MTAQIRHCCEAIPIPAQRPWAASPQAKILQVRCVGGTNTGGYYSIGRSSVLVSVFSSTRLTDKFRQGNKSSLSAARSKLLGPGSVGGWVLEASPALRLVSPTDFDTICWISTHSRTARISSCMCKQHTTDRSRSLADSVSDSEYFSGYAKTCSCNAHMPVQSACAHTHCRSYTELFF